MEEQVAKPLCLSTQPFSEPGVMYFTSPMILPSVENSLTSVRRPGTVLVHENGRIEFKKANLAGEMAKALT